MHVGGRKAGTGRAAARRCAIEPLEHRALLAVSFTVDIVDDGSRAAYHDRIRSHLLAAAEDWGRRFVSNASLAIQVHFSPTTLRASGRSFVSVFVRNNGQYNVAEEGAVHELRTGVDPNGAAPDIEIYFQDDYLVNEMWFDPDPRRRTAPMAPNRVDAYSVCLHELGHALGFNGWKDGYGNVPADYVSRWDEYVVSNSQDLFFTGPSARSVYGGNVPVTWGLPNHIGNRAPRPGPDLIPDLMNGVVANHATRYSISELDFAIVKDAGAPVRPVLTTVSGRHVFYNGSAFDGRDPAPTAADLAAVAPDKRPLLPGQHPSFANVTSYSKGINGVLVEFAGTPPATLRASDFDFRAGRAGDAAQWAPELPAAVALLPTPTGANLTRYAITWPDGAIQNEWLRVTVKATERTGLARPDEFLFGNLPGETGDDGAAAPRVSFRDALNTRRGVGAGNVGPDDRHDHNRDGRVNAADLAIVLRAQLRSLPALVTPILTAAAVIVPPPQRRFLYAVGAARPDELGL